MTITKGDTLPDFISIDIKNDTNVVINKMIVQIGVIQREYINPTFPVLLSFTSDESKLFSHKNTVDVAVFHGNGIKQTAKGVAEFYANSERIFDN